LSCAKQEEGLKFQWFIIFLLLSSFSKFVQVRVDFRAERAPSLISSTAPCLRHQCRLPCGIGLGPMRFGFLKIKNPASLFMRNGVFDEH
jgi:hypothetical protein